MPAEPEDTNPSRHRGYKTITLVAVCIASFLESFDAQVAAVALPGIQQGLGADFDDLQLIFNAYTLTFATLLSISGSLADLFGRRRLFIAGITVLASASVLCALATSPLFLGLGRLLQGVGASVTFTTTLALLVQEFRGRERAVAFGVWSASLGTGLVVGPLAGGVLTDAFGWRSVFVANVPFAAAAIVLALVGVRESRDPAAARLDWPGLATFTTSFFLLMLALIYGNGVGWTSAAILGAFAGAFVMLVAFVIVERARSRPMFDLTLFRSRTFVGTSAVIVAMCFSFFAYGAFLPLYFQSVLGASGLGSGLMMVAFGGPLVLMGYVGGKLAALMPARLHLAAGLSLLASGLLWMGLVAPPTYAGLLVGLLAAGAGTGVINGQVANVVMSIVPEQRSGMASMVQNTMRQLGFGVGVAGMGALFAFGVGNRLSSLTAGTPAQAADGGTFAGLVGQVAAGDIQGAASSLPAGAQSAFAAAATQSFNYGMDLIFVAGGLVALAGAVAALVLIRTEVTPSAEAEADPDVRAEEIAHQTPNVGAR